MQIVNSTGSKTMSDFIRDRKPSLEDCDHNGQVLVNIGGIECVADWLETNGLPWKSLNKKEDEIDR